MYNTISIEFYFPLQYITHMWPHGVGSGAEYGWQMCEQGAILYVEVSP